MADNMPLIKGHRGNGGTGADEADAGGLGSEKESCQAMCVSAKPASFAFS